MPASCQSVQSNVDVGVGIGICVDVNASVEFMYVSIDTTKLSRLVCSTIEASKHAQIE